MIFVFQELELSLTDVWRTWVIFDRRVTNLSYLWPTCDELELTWAIFDRRVTNSSHLWPTCDELELSLADVWRTWAIFDRRVTNLSYLGPMSVGLPRSSTRCPIFFELFRKFEVRATQRHPIYLGSSTFDVRVCKIFISWLFGVRFRFLRN
jgi:hypothetical protein